MIKNATKNTVISNSFINVYGLGKIRGLIGKGNKTYVFKTRFGIHTFFLKSPIDVIILDKNKKAVILKAGLKPNRIFFWNIKYDNVIELPQNSIQNSKTEKSDQIKLIS